MSAEVEIVELTSANTLLPNLTISVDTDENKGDNDLPEITAETEDQDELPDESEVKVNVLVKPKLVGFPNKKLYENKKLGGLGLSFEELRERRKKRAQRFASPLVKEDELIEDLAEYDEKADKLLQRVEKYNENLQEESDDKIRNAVLHLRGVDNMSTDEIFGYFGSMDPKHIEWIDDTSCNVVWDLAKNAAVALEKIAHPVRTESKVEKKPKTKVRHQSVDDELDLNEMEVDDVEQEASDASDDNNDDDSDFVNDIRDCKEAFCKDGYQQHMKIRFAFLKDRKHLGAAKRSKYYVEHGNPHYGGAKGLFSGTYRKRYQMRNAMQELQGMKVGSSYAREKAREENQEESSHDAPEQNKVKTDNEKMDETLMKTSAKDLDGAIPVYSSEEDKEEEEEEDDQRFGSMVADRVAKEIKAARSMSGGVQGRLTVTAPNTDVRSRLGKRRHDDRIRHSERSGMLDRLPNDLRNRLGQKHRSHANDSSRDSSRYSSRDSSRYSSRDSSRYSSRDSSRYSTRDSSRYSSRDVERRSRDRSPHRRPQRKSPISIASSISGRRMKRYSPTPWDDDEDDDDDYDDDV